MLSRGFRSIVRAGLLFGYAFLTEAEIRTGIRRLAEVM
jgi:hypothetical protein